MTGRNREIDWLRAYAVMLVILHHGTLLLPAPNPWEGVIGTWFSGTTGVDLFFVISGFVIAQSFLGRFDAALDGGPVTAFESVVGFIKRRFLRLYPASLFWAFVILLGTALRPMAPWQSLEMAFGKFVANALYLSNFNELAENTPFGYYWSLALEMQFYLLLPVFLACCRNTRLRLTVLLAIVVLSPLISFDGWWMFRISGLALGVALHIAVSNIGNRLDPFAGLGPGNRVFTGAMVAALLLVTLAMPAVPTLAVTVASLLALVLVYAATFERGYVASFGAGPVLDWIGTRSYSLYLAHIPIMLFNQAAWAKALGQQGLALTPDYAMPMLASAAIAVALAAEASYRFIEQPFQRGARPAVARTAAAE